MATLQAATLAILNSDTDLISVFTGGFLDADSLPNRGLTYSTISKKDDGVTIQPTGVLRWRGPNSMRGPDNAARWFVEIYLYDDPSSTTDKIVYAKRRIWELLHDKYLGNTDHEGFAWFVWLGDIGNTPEGAIDDTLLSNMDQMRFQVDTTRKRTTS